MNVLAHETIYLIIENVNPRYYYFIYQVSKLFRKTIMMIYNNNPLLKQIPSWDVLALMMFDIKGAYVHSYFLEGINHLNMRKLCLDVNFVYNTYNIEYIISNACRNNELYIIKHIEINNSIDHDLLLDKACKFNQIDIISYCLNSTKPIFKVHNAILGLVRNGNYDMAEILTMKYTIYCPVSLIQLLLTYNNSSSNNLIYHILKKYGKCFTNKQYKSLIKSANKNNHNLVNIIIKHQLSLNG